MELAKHQHAASKIAAAAGREREIMQQEMERLRQLHGKEVRKPFVRVHGDYL